MKREKDKRPARAAAALHYDGRNAPRLTAKGVGAVAEEIVRIAEENDVPLQEDAELAALLGQIDLGEEIPRELYLAVAEVLAFAFIVTGRFPPGWKPDED